MGYAYVSGNVYGRGDYYRGDYYRGDPGILRAIGGAVRGFVTGGPGGAIVGAVAGFRRPSAVQGTALAPIPQIPPPPISQTQIGPGGMIYKRTEYGAEVSGVPMHAPGCPCGTCSLNGRRGHFNKSTYVTRGGGTSRWPPSLMVHPKGSECVPNRRMNVANPRALRRAIRRGRGFLKLARKSASAFGFTVVSRGRGKKTAKRR